MLTSAYEAGPRSSLTCRSLYYSFPVALLIHTYKHGQAVEVMVRPKQQFNLNKLLAKLNLSLNLSLNLCLLCRLWR